MGTMKRLLIISIAFTFLQCSDCLHCNESWGILRYSVINTLDRELIMEIYGEDIVTQLKIRANDTSRTWDIIALPAEFTSPLFSIDQFNEGNSFSFDSDSILIRIDQEILAKFFIQDDYKTPEWETSIYNIDNYISFRAEEETSNISLNYYLLDSVNLNLN